MYAQKNLLHWELLQSFGIKSFKTFDKVSLKGRVQSYPWVKGVALIKILENPKVAQAVKEKLWSIYESKLIELTNEFTSKRPDLTFDINHLPYFNKLHAQINKADNLSFKELRISGIPSTLDRITFRQRYMIEVYEDENEDPIVLEPKPDNILVDLTTWEMTWIDPN